MRTITINLTADGKATAATGDTGRAGEHNVTEIIATIPPELAAATDCYAMRFEAAGTIFDAVALMEIDGNVSYALPLGVLGGEGEITWQLVGYKATGGDIAQIWRSNVVTLYVSESIIGDGKKPEFALQPVEQVMAAVNEGVDATKDLIAGIEQRLDNGDFDGADGTNGDNGATFVPSVSSNSDLSWTNDKGLPNPLPVNIRGLQGLQGVPGQDGTMWYAIQNEQDEYHFRFSVPDGSFSVVTAEYYSQEFAIGDVLKKVASNTLEYRGNIRGADGFIGPPGIDGRPGTSATVSVLENTDKAYRLLFADDSGQIATPNLLAPGYRHIATAKVTQEGLLSVVISADKHGDPFTLRQAKIMISVDGLSTLPPQGEGSAGIGLGVSINGVSDAVYMSGSSLSTNWSISAIRNKFYSTVADLSCHNGHINGIAPYNSIGTTSGGAADTVGYDRLGLATLPHPGFDAIRRVEFFISSSVHRFPLGAEFQLWGVE